MGLPQLSNRHYEEPTAAKKKQGMITMSLLLSGQF